MSAYELRLATAMIAAGVMEVGPDGKTLRPKKTIDGTGKRR